MDLGAPPPQPASPPARLNTPTQFQNQQTEVQDRHDPGGVQGQSPWPSLPNMSALVTELRLKRAEKVLEVEFADGARFALPAEYLRVESPSAEVQGHGPGQKVIIAGRRHVGIMRVEPVGHYAVRILFDDLHDSGIFSWDYLHRLGSGQARIWGEYEAALAARGLSRDPARP